MLGFNSAGSFRYLNDKEQLEKLYNKITTKIREIESSSDEKRMQAKKMIQDDLEKLNLPIENFSLPWGHELYIESVRDYALQLTDAIPLYIESLPSGSHAHENYPQQSTLFLKKQKNDDGIADALLKQAKEVVEKFAHSSWLENPLRDLQVVGQENFWNISCSLCSITIRASELKTSNFKRHVENNHKQPKPLHSDDKTNKRTNLSLSPETSSSSPAKSTETPKEKVVVLEVIQTNDDSSKNEDKVS